LCARELGNRFGAYWSWKWRQRTTEEEDSHELVS
jgi:hypothetical protein